MTQRQSIRLVVADLDGTVLDKTKMVRPDLRDAVRSLRRRGVAFTIATGRVFASAARYALDLEIREPIIAANGAVVKNPVTGLELRDLRLPASVAREVLGLTRHLGAATYVFTGDRILVDRPSSFSPRYWRSLGHPITLSRDIMAEDLGEPTMIVVYVGSHRASTLRQEFSQRLHGRAEVTSSMPYFIDFLHPLASKASGVELLAKHLGIPVGSIMAVGDGYNDVGMLRYAGVGVLVANAPGEIRNLADHITEAPATDGVLEALRTFVGNV